NDNVDDRADNEGTDDTDGEIPFRVSHFLRHGGDSVEPDVGEEDDRGTSLDAGPAVGSEGVPVLGSDIFPPDENEEAEYNKFQQHHACIHRCALPDADHEHDGYQRNDAEREDIEDNGDAEEIDRKSVV